MKAVSSALASFTQEDISKLEKEGKTEIPIDGKCRRNHWRRWK